MPGTTVGVKIGERTRERLKALARVKERSVHNLMKEALARYLDSEEGYERERAEDRARWERYVDTGEAISDEDMMAWLDDLADTASRKADSR
jgi:predicted transcriptional regulator